MCKRRQINFFTLHSIAGMRRFGAPFLLPLLLFVGCAPDASLDRFAGETMGTTYQISAESGHFDRAAGHKSIDSLLLKVNESMSTYMETSLISRINASTDTTEGHPIDDHFLAVFEKAREVYERTGGAFNPAVAPLIDAWGFGAEQPHTLSEAEVDSLLNQVDFDAFVLDAATGTLRKTRPDVALNFSAIAKGYGVDAVARWLESRGVYNYFVEIGGEIRTNGENPAGRPWRVGIDRPEDAEGQPRSIQAIIPLEQASMATSGNYRNFYVRDGRKFVHTINPATGYPEISSLLSATVIAPDCMTADAYATAFMVMGLEQARQFVSQQAELEVYFISSDEEGNYVEYFSEGFPAKIDSVEE